MTIDDCRQNTTLEVTLLHPPPSYIHPQHVLCFASVPARCLVRQGPPTLQYPRTRSAPPESRMVSASTALKQGYLAGNGKSSAQNKNLNI